jgi:cell pole-organizing protein PopZ
VEDEPVPFVPLRRRAEQFAARLASTPDQADLPVPDAAPAELASDGVDLATDSTPAAPARKTGPDAPHSSQVVTELLNEDGTPLAVLDETALAEIVRQVLRAELQGDLGERITRNVRKLVRAEINRALIARDLD